MTTGTLIINMYVIIPTLDEDGRVNEDVLKSKDKMVTLLRKSSLTKYEARAITLGFLESNQLRRREVNARWVPNTEYLFDGYLDL